MRRLVIVLAIAILFLPTGGMRAQRTASTALSVNVVPEAHLNPGQIPFRFVVTPDGSGNITSQSQTVSMWVRALPGQSIHLKARLGVVSGPVIEWAGSAESATAGGRVATCTNGSFVGGSSVDLVGGWTQSGTLACNVQLSLADPGTLAPGVYTGTVDLTLTTQ